MNTKKLWLFSILFGVLATVCFYFFMNTKETSEPVLAATKTEEKPVTQTEPADQLTVEAGKRAISIEVKEVAGIAGYIKPNVRVDVIAKLTPPKGSPPNTEEEARILLENVKVLAIGHAADEPAERKKYKLVTLEVTPKQGLALSFAAKYELYLMLRNDSDNKIEHAATIHETDLHKGVFSE